MCVAAPLIVHLNVMADRGQYAVSVLIVGSGILVGQRVVLRLKAGKPAELGPFWIRRLRRLAVPLLIALALAMGWALLYGTQSELARTRGESGAALFGVLNIRQILSADPYRALSDGFVGTEHLWTVSIEEQFYLCLVLLVVGITAWVPRPRRLQVFTAAAGVMVVWGLVVGQIVARDPSWQPAYLRPDVRMAEFGVGLLLAVVMRSEWVRRLDRRPALTDAVAVVSLAITVVLWFSVSFQWAVRSPWSFTAMALLAAFWLIPVTRPGRFANAWSLPPLVAFGQRSYGIYVYSLPVFLWISQRTLSIPQAAVIPMRLIALAVVVELSYRYVETPLRQRGFKGTKLLWPSWAAVALVAGLVFAAGHVSREADNETLRLEDPFVRVFNQTEKNALATDTDLGRVGDAGASGAKGDTVVMVTGESLAANLAHGMTRTTPKGFAVFDRSQPGCPLWPDRVQVYGQWRNPADICVAAWKKRVSGYLKTVRPKVVVAWIIAPSVANQELDGKRVAAADPAASAADVATLQEFSTMVRDAGAKLVFVGLPPVDVPAEQQSGFAYAGMPGMMSQDLFRRWNDELRAEAAKVGAVYVDSAAVLAGPDGGFARSIGGRQVRSVDGVHLTPAGADRMSQAVWAAMGRGG